MALTDAERVFLEALRTVRAKLMDTITGLDDTIAEVEQAAAARITGDPPPACPVCKSALRRRQINVSAGGDEPKQFLDGPWFCPKGHDI